jgi:hypothetical protein
LAMRLSGRRGEDMMSEENSISVHRAALRNGTGWDGVWI